MKQQFTILNKYTELFIAVSSKADGGMKIRYDLDKDIETLQNREKYLKQFGLSNSDIITAQLIQGDNITSVSKKDIGKVIPNTDSLITSDRGAYLAITTADCLPIFIYDPKKQTIALVHAGWKGLAVGIIEKTIEQLIDDYKSEPQNLIVGIGAGIDTCHFEVKEDVANKFTDYKDEIEIRDNKTFIDLKQIALKQLLKAGVSKSNIEINPDCTYHNEEYFSFRRDKTLPLKANLVVFGLKD